MGKESDNKAIVGRWFTDFWGENCDLGVVDELAAPDMLLQYSLHEPRRGHKDIKAFVGSAAARTPVRRSPTSSSARYPPRPAVRCGSRAPRCSGSRTAKSPRRSAWTMA